jgi:hypothetical protein
VTIVSLLAALMGLLILPLTLRPVTMSRIGIAIALWLIHMAVAVVYYAAVQKVVSDTQFYYYSGYYFDARPWSTLATVLVGHLTQLLKRGIGASYLDCFMFFQAVGYWGLMLMMRTFDEIHRRCGIQPMLLPTLILFLPSLHYWTSAIGKDAPLFFALNLCVWSALSFAERYKWLVLSVFIMMVFRPHIALITVLALAIAALVHGQFSVGRKFAIMAVGIVAGIFLASTLRTNLNIDVTNADSLGQFLEGRGAAEASDVGTTGYASAAVWLRIISMLFRPFFFDARSIPAVVASFENVGSVLLIGYLIRYQRDVRFLARRVFFVRFMIVLVIILLIILGMFSYNVGLALRQRVMPMVPLLALFVSIWVARMAERTRLQPAIAATEPALAGSAG